MSEKKNSVVENATKNADVSANNIPKKKAAVKNDDGFCVYIGPSIMGVVQNGTIYKGNKKDTLKSLAQVINKYPLVASLVVEDKTLSEDRIKVSTPGNLLYVNYHKLIKGKN